MNQTRKCVEFVVGSVRTGALVELEVWSWRESNPRPSDGHRPRYDHSRASGSTVASPPDRVGHEGPPPRLSWKSAFFHAVSGLSLPSSTASVAGLRWTGPGCHCWSRCLSDL